MSVPVIDVHTHMLSDEYLKFLAEKGAPLYTIADAESIAGIKPTISKNGAPFLQVLDEMMDFDIRIKNLDIAKVDISIMSLTCPNALFGSREDSLTVARMMNDRYAQAQRAYPDRLRWYATLPWQYPEDAVAELERAVGIGAVGVVVIGNLEGEHLIDPRFDPIWSAIDKLGLPVQIHPAIPPGVSEMQMDKWHLGSSNGFLFDTTLALSKMIMSGFFDTYPNLKIIGLHGGGTIPYLIGRLDRCWEAVPSAREKISAPPSTYLSRFYVDSVVYRIQALQLAVAEMGDDNVLYGSDYPHSIGDMAGVLSRVNMLNMTARNKICGLNAMKLFKL